jgi:hypothetical protein
LPPGCSAHHPLPIIPPLKRERSGDEGERGIGRTRETHCCRRIHIAAAARKEREREALRDEREEASAACVKCEAR